MGNLIPELNAEDGQKALRKIVNFLIDEKFEDAIDFDDKKLKTLDHKTLKHYAFVLLMKSIYTIEDALGYIPFNQK